MGQQTLRSDGRRHDQLRPFLSEQSVLSRADGSTRLSADEENATGDTTVMIAVYGPKACTNPRLEHPERAGVEVMVKPPTEANRGSGPAEKSQEELLQQIISNVVKLELFPRSAISVTAQVLHDAGSLESVLVNCLCLALLDSAIPMKNIFVASCAALSSDDTITLDPLEPESQEAHGKAFVCSWGSDSSELIASNFTGRGTSTQVSSLNKACKKATETVASYLDLAITRRGKRDARPQKDGTQVTTLKSQEDKES